MTHFNVQIHIQQVIEPKPIEDKNGYPVKTGPMGVPAMTERQVIEVLKLAITADTELDAYLKAHKILSANEPIPALPPFVRDEDLP